MTNYPKILRLHDGVSVHIVSSYGGRQTGNVSWINNGHVYCTTKEEAEVLLFLGGSDISPELYGQESKANCGYIDKNRDDYEVEMYKYGVENKKIMFGICRGLQLLTALNGGKIIQHVSHHQGGTHPIIIAETGEKVTTNTIHHQMCFPYNLDKDDYRVLAFCTKEHFPHMQPSNYTYLVAGEELFLYDKFYEVNRKVKYITHFCEPEMIVYPKTLSLGVQGHPEMFYNYSVYESYLKYINQILLQMVYIQRNKTTNKIVNNIQKIIV